MAYGMWLSYNNGQKGFQFPVNPGAIKISESGNSKTYDVMGLGEINVLRSPALSEISFEGFFPSFNARKATVGGKVVDPFVVASLQFEPRKYVNLIKGWMGSKRPVRFIFTGDTFGINTAVSIENFEWEEVAGSGGDIEYSIQLKRYVFYAPRKLKLVQANTTAIASVVDDGTDRANEKEQPKTYTLRSGDNLWKVAKLQLGDGARWKEIQTLNKISDAQLKKLQIGMVIKLPTSKGAAVNA